MEVDKNQIFNLWDTNGRRSDVLNALNIYLNILKEMIDEGTFDKWASFPNSLTQFIFYSKAVELSPEIFKSHPKYDDFVEELGVGFTNPISKKEFTDLLNNRDELMDVLDSAIEQRARHYTSNLVRFGLATKKRIISPVGYSYLNSKIERDEFEKMLPLNDMNVILLRQLMKLRIFSKENNGTRTYYSPFYACLSLLLNNTIDKDDFISIIQGLNPYCNIEIVSSLFKSNNISSILKIVADGDKTIDTPVTFMLPGKISESNFNNIIKNRKTNKTVNCYYAFYDALFEFRLKKSQENYNKLKNIYINNKEKIKKAFSWGKNLFDFGTNGVYSLDVFLENNKENVYLNEKDFNNLFYRMYDESKKIDQINEYSDTTIRVLGATGWFKFKNLPELSNKELVKTLFSSFDIESHIFGTCSEDEYQKYEEDENSIYSSNLCFSEILGYSNENITSIKTKLSDKYGTNDSLIIKDKIETKISKDFIAYVKSKYTKDKVAYILSLFSDRANDSTIKKEVNESASVPTIYEFIVGIAWYYISNEDFDLYRSLNLTLNADFEPEMHAGGGMGDIVINYGDKSVMLEVTLMNKSAQKRGEWEPVLRHSLNNKAKHMEVENYTFFIADELDYNTINIWRAIAAVPLRSTSGEVKDINGVIIMPFTNANIIDFINKSVSSINIINEVKKSFAAIPKITESNWHEEIIDSL